LGGRGRGPHGFGPGHGPGDARHVDRLTAALSLTEEQQAAFATIREETRTAIDARHEQARAAFRALLTEVQRAKLDEIEALHGRP
jgi:Spy/CpxP family protein refolding chaperone